MANKYTRKEIRAAGYTLFFPYLDIGSKAERWYWRGGYYTRGQIEKNMDEGIKGDYFIDFKILKIV